METLLGMVISAALAATASIVVGQLSHNKTVAILQERIDNLTYEVRKHNGVVERTFELERNVALLQQDSKTAWHAIDEIKGRMDS